MKYVERCLWDYRANVAMLEMLRARVQELQSVRGHSYEAHSMNGISDPVAEVTNKVLGYEKKMEKTKTWIEPVRTLEEDLRAGKAGRSSLLWILWLKYFDHMGIDDVKRELSVSGSTLYRQTLELLRLAKGYFADVS